MRENDQLFNAFITLFYSVLEIHQKANIIDQYLKALESLRIRRVLAPEKELEFEKARMNLEDASVLLKQAVIS